jgi:hypothetical protein
VKSLVDRISRIAGKRKLEPVPQQVRLLLNADPKLVERLERAGTDDDMLDIVEVARKRACFDWTPAEVKSELAKVQEGLKRGKEFLRSAGWSASSVKKWAKNLSQKELDAFATKDAIVHTKALTKIAEKPKLDAIPAALVSAAASRVPPSKAKSALRPGDWKAPVITYESFSCTTTGVTLATQAEFQSLLKVVRKVSQPLALVVPRAAVVPAEWQSEEVEVPLESDGRTTVFKAKLVQLGEKPVERCSFAPRVSGAADGRAKTQVIVLEMTKRYTGDDLWKSFAQAAGRGKLITAMKEKHFLKEGESDGILDVFNFRRMERGGDEHIEALLRVQLPLVDPLLRRSGEEGFFTRLVGDRESAAWKSYRIVWLGGDRGLAEAVKLARVHGAVGVIPGGRNLGVRVPADKYDELFKAIRGSAPQPKETHVLDHVPWDWDGDDVAHALQGAGWSGSLSTRRAGGRWFVRADKEPPKDLGVLECEGGKLITINAKPEGERKTGRAISVPARKNRWTKFKARRNAGEVIDVEAADGDGAARPVPAVSVPDPQRSLTAPQAAAGERPSMDEEATRQAAKRVRSELSPSGTPAGVSKTELQTLEDKLEKRFMERMATMQETMDKRFADLLTAVQLLSQRQAPPAPAASAGGARSRSRSRNDGEVEVVGGGKVKLEKGAAEAEAEMRERADAWMRSAGLLRHPVAGDGNCWWRSWAVQLGLPWEVVKQRVLEYAEKNAAFYEREGLVPNVRRFVRQHAQANAWVRGMMVQITVDCFQRPAELWSTRMEHTRLEPRGGRSVTSSTVHIRYECGMHFDPLVKALKVKAEPAETEVPSTASKTSGPSRSVDASISELLARLRSAVVPPSVKKETKQEQACSMPSPSGRKIPAGVTGKSVDESLAALLADLRASGPAPVRPTQGKKEVKQEIVHNSGRPPQSKRKMGARFDTRFRIEQDRRAALQLPKRHLWSLTKVGGMRCERCEMEIGRPVLWNLGRNCSKRRLASNGIGFEAPKWAKTKSLLYVAKRIHEHNTKAEVQNGTMHELDSDGKSIFCVRCTARGAIGPNVQRYYKMKCIGVRSKRPKGPLVARRADLQRRIAAHNKRARVSTARKQRHIFKIFGNAIVCTRCDISRPLATWTSMVNQVCPGQLQLRDVKGGFRPDSLRVISANIDAWNTGWAPHRDNLKEYSNAVHLLQETKLAAQDVHFVERQVRSSGGGHLVHSPPKPMVRSGSGFSAACGGAAVFCPAELRPADVTQSCPLWAHVQELCDAAVARFQTDRGAVLVASVYLSPSMLAEPRRAALLAIAAAITASADCLVVVGGDFNLPLDELGAVADLLHEGALFDLSDVGATHFPAGFTPSRIDYLFGNTLARACFCEAFTCRGDEFPRHKPLVLELNLKVLNYRCWQWDKFALASFEDGPVTPEIWRQHWSPSGAEFAQALGAGDTQTAWHVWCKVALQALGSDVFVEDGRLRRGELPRFSRVSRRGLEQRRRAERISAESVDAKAGKVVNILREIAARLRRQEAAGDDVQRAWSKAQLIVRSLHAEGWFGRRASWFDGDFPTDADEVDAVRTEVMHQLQHRAYEAKRARIQTWKSSMRSRWIGDRRRVFQWIGAGAQQPAPLTACSEDGSTVHSPDEIVAAVRDKWKAIYCQYAGRPEPDGAAFVNKYGGYIKAAPCTLPELTGKAVFDTVRAWDKHSSAGFDLWLPCEWQRLPAAAFEPVASILRSVEEGFPWPSSQCYVRVACIPKDGAEDASDTRPISVCGLLYRAWSTTRMRHLEPWLGKVCSRNAFGATPARSTRDMAVPLYMRMEALEVEHDEGLFGAHVDAAKYFDSLPWDAMYAVARRAGMQPAVCETMRRFAGDAKKLFGIGGAYCVDPLVATNGIMQGCSLSLALVRLMASLWERLLQEKVTNDELQGVVSSYLDDRTMTAGTQELLQRFVSETAELDRDMGIQCNVRKSCVWSTASVEAPGVMYEEKALPVVQRTSALGFPIATAAELYKEVDHRLQGAIGPLLRLARSGLGFEMRALAAAATSGGRMSYALEAAVPSKDAERAVLRALSLAVGYRGKHWCAREVVWNLFIQGHRLVPWMAAAVQVLAAMQLAAQRYPLLVGPALARFRAGGPRTGLFMQLKAAEGRLNLRMCEDGTLHDLYTNEHVAISGLTRQAWAHWVRERIRRQAWSELQRRRATFDGVGVGVDRIPTLRLLRSRSLSYLEEGVLRAVLSGSFYIGRGKVHARICHHSQCEHCEEFEGDESWQHLVRDCPGTRDFFQHVGDEASSWPSCFLSHGLVPYGAGLARETVKAHQLGLLAFVQARMVIMSGRYPRPPSGQRSEEGLVVM